MKIVVISTIDNKGGAAGISWELRKRLKADGHTVSTFVRYKYSNEPDVFAIPRKRYQDWLVKLFADDLRFARTGFIFETKEYREADIIHCHNLHSNFFNLHDLERMSREKPVVWTIHDLWAITGFSNDSVTLRHPNKKRFLLFLWDNTARLLKAKRNIYEKSRLRVVAVSDWLKDMIKKSILAAQHTERIYNGVDLEIFKPYEKTTARIELDLPLEKKIVGFPLKGWIQSNLIVDAWKDREDVHFVAIGHSNIRTINENYSSLGRIEDPEKMARVYSALDVLFYPTQGDTFGLTAAESMACGTPVVAYGVDALPEIVSHKETGYIAKPDEIRDAKKGIEFVLGLSSSEFESMREKCSNRASSLFSAERMYREYLELYRRILKREPIS